MTRGCGALVFSSSPGVCDRPCLDFDVFAGGAFAFACNCFPVNGGGVVAEVGVAEELSMGLAPWSSTGLSTFGRRSRTAVVARFPFDGAGSSLAHGGSVAVSERLLPGREPVGS